MLDPGAALSITFATALRLTTLVAVYVVFVANTNGSGICLLDRLSG
jgi:hypothetical protein